jgi:V/A-type H+-transporting ATPase subunit C
MLMGTPDNLDFLAARLHGRRSRMAAGERLESLCQAQTMPRFATKVLGESDTGPAAEVQRRLTQDLATEMAGIASQLTSTGSALLRWLAVRFQVENLKVLLRGMLAGASWESLRRHLLELPREMAIDAQSLATARSVDEFLHRMPRGPLRKSLGEAVQSHREARHPFFFETALDKGYFTELLTRTEALGGEDKEQAKPLVLQEIDTLHLMLVARGKFIHGLESAALLPFHVPGTGIVRARLAAMLAEADLRTAASRALGIALDALPGRVGESGAAVTPADIEAAAWNRFQRLANRAFRRSHMGLAAVVAFVELRRVEVANLITLSEGIRLGIPAEQLRARLIPRPMMEVAHV